MGQKLKRRRASLMKKCLKTCLWDAENTVPWQDSILQLAGIKVCGDTMDPGSHIQYTTVYGLFSSSFYVNTHTHASTHSHAHIHSVTYTTLVLLDPQQCASGTPKWKDLPWSLAFWTSKDLLPYTSKNRGELSRAYKWAKLYSWACTVCEAAGGLPAFSVLSESLRKIVSVT